MGRGVPKRFGPWCGKVGRSIWGAALPQGKTPNFTQSHKDGNNPHTFTTLPLASPSFKPKDKRIVIPHEGLQGCPSPQSKVVSELGNYVIRVILKINLRSKQLFGSLWRILAHLPHEDMHSQNSLGGGTTM